MQVNFHEWISSGHAATFLTHSAPTFRAAIQLRAVVLLGRKITTITEAQMALPRREAARADALWKAFAEWTELVGSDLAREPRDVINHVEALAARVAGGGSQRQSATPSLAAAGRAALRAEDDGASRRRAAADDETGRAEATRERRSAAGKRAEAANRARREVPAVKRARCVESGHRARAKVEEALQEARDQAAQRGDQLMITREAADHLGIRTSRLESWRRGSGGPPFARVGNTVVYLRSALEAWQSK
ncbi:hypothetical protein RDV64_19860 [Acuticoccus sp. MNP-M23]|uniref:hypothetical protein n=1 Tax=Acuticoccus sp. MNP-M23 TaxID=3072793 RepID=UPI0028163B59|nr:hypothetical protein [Acuticoccus sp. MNP-M23]WMS42294.1 hypothetical protein RDV64_19860 [Acuticoccus sp. MNP-M23]